MFRRFVSSLIASVVLLFVVSANILPHQGIGGVAMAASTWTQQQEQYLRTTLASEIGIYCEAFPGVFYKISDDEILLDCYPPGQGIWTVVRVDTFMEFYSDAIPDTASPSSLPAPIYNGLSAIESASCSGPDGCLGYQTQFDKWRDKGLIN